MPKALTIKISILMVIAGMALGALFSIAKYSMISIPPGVIKKVEFYSDKDLQEIKMTGKLKRHDKIEIPTYPKVFAAKIKKDYHVVYIDSKKYYVNVFVSYWYGSWLYLIIALSIFIASSWLLMRLCIKEEIAKFFVANF